MYMLNRRYPPSAAAFRGLAELLEGAPYFYLVCHEDGWLSVDDPDIDGDCRWTMSSDQVRALIEADQFPEDLSE